MNITLGHRTMTTSSTSRDGAPIVDVKSSAGLTAVTGSHAGTSDAQCRTDTQQEILSEIVAWLRMPVDD